MEYNYKFSVIMPIYNTEKYLEEAIESIVNQDIGFRDDNVQLILVDDGSTDGCNDICLRYQEKYPDNILLLTKENGGLSSALNYALDYIEGEYVTFFDSDDKLESNTLSVVYDFYSKHKDEVDIVSIPFVFFDRRTGDHVLNYKYNTERIVDLEKTPHFPQLAINSSFIKNEVIKEHRFSYGLVTGEDAIVVNRILLDRKKIGFINRTRYFYRKRQDESSMVDKAKTKKEFFIPRLKDYFMVFIKDSIEKLGYVPKFTQYVIAYDIQWYYPISDFPDFLSEEEIKEFWDTFAEVLSYIDDDVINDSRIIKRVYVRSFLMYVKNHKDFSIEKDEEGILCLKTGNHVINHLNNHIIYFEDITLKSGFLSFSGNFTSSCNYNNLKVEAIRTYEDGREETYDETKDLEKSQIRRFLGIDWHYKYHFDFKMPVEENENSRIRFDLIYEENSNRVVMNNNIRFKDDAILFDNINYFVKDAHIVVFEEDSFAIYPFSYEKYYQLKDELNSHIQELIDLNKELTKENKALERENNKLIRQNESLKNKNMKLNTKNKKLNTKYVNMKRKNDEILNSTSWKITKPLRESKNLVSKH